MKKNKNKNRTKKIRNIRREKSSWDNRRWHRERERKVKEKEIQKDTKIENGKTKNQQETKMKKTVS